MTGAPIDGSIRRAVLTDESPGNIVSDSRKKLDDAPLAIMEPGTEQVALNFLDKKGLTDAYGNVYVGYGNAGGSSFTVSHSQPESLDTEVDDANDGDVLVYVLAEEKWLPFSYEQVGIPRLDPNDTPTNNQILVYDTVDDVWRPTTPNYLTPSTGARVAYPASEADILVYDQSSNFWIPKPQIITDYFAVVIEAPTNRTYTLTMALPYEITITTTDFDFESGPGSVSFPSGTIAPNTPIQIVVSGATSASEFLTVQINFTRNLGILP